MTQKIMHNNVAIFNALILSKFVVTENNNFKNTVADGLVKKNLFLFNNLSASEY